MDLRIIIFSLLILIILRLCEPLATRYVSIVSEIASTPYKHNKIHLLFI